MTNTTETKTVLALDFKAGDLVRIGKGATQWRVHLVTSRGTAVLHKVDQAGRGAGLRSVQASKLVHE